MNGVRSLVGHQVSAITTGVSTETKQSRLDQVKASFLKLPKESVSQRLIGAYKVSSVEMRDLARFQAALERRFGEGGLSRGQEAALQRSFFSKSSDASQEKLDKFFEPIDTAKKQDQFKEAARILGDALAARGHELSAELFAEFRKEHRGAKITDMNRLASEFASKLPMASGNKNLGLDFSGESISAGDAPVVPFSETLGKVGDSVIGDEMLKSDLARLGGGISGRMIDDAMSEPSSSEARRDELATEGVVNRKASDADGTEKEHGLQPMAGGQEPSVASELDEVEDSVAEDVGKLWENYVSDALISNRRDPNNYHLDLLAEDFRKTLEGLDVDVENAKQVSRIFDSRYIGSVDPILNQFLR